jgi:GNAT superfamily N-acetyltransferase
MLTIKRVSTQQELKTFVKFPMRLYKGNPYYVPPLINDELQVFDRDKNQVFRNADAELFLCFRESEVVGRVAAMVNWIEVKDQGKPKARFGWLDMIDDVAVTKKLLGTVEEFARTHSLEFLEGPVGFSNMDKAGMLVKGFEELSTMITWYNHPYYARHMEELGFEKSAEWVEFKFGVPEKIPQKIDRFANVIAERFGLRPLNFNSTADILPYVDEMFDLLNETYSSLVTFVPIQKYQIEHYKKKYIPYINPKFLKCVVDESGRLVAFAITMPSFSRALQRAKGKLFPFGFWHLLRARKNNSRAAFYLIGVHPEYRGKGVTALIFRNVAEPFLEYDIELVETNPELEDNVAVQALWKNYDPVLHKRRRTYRKNL